jgi:hypothetical protein
MFLGITGGLGSVRLDHCKSLTQEENVTMADRYGSILFRTMTLSTHAVQESSALNSFAGHQQDYPQNSHRVTK